MGHLLTVSGLDLAGFLSGLGLLTIADRAGLHTLELSWSRTWPQLAVSSRPAAELVELVAEDARTYRPRWLDAADRAKELADVEVRDSDYSDEHDAASYYSHREERQTSLVMGIGHQDLLRSGRVLRDLVTPGLIADAIDGAGGRPVLAVPPHHASLRLSVAEGVGAAYRGDSSAPVPISIGQQWLAWRGISVLPETLLGRRAPHVLWREPAGLRAVVAYLRRWFACRPWQDRQEPDWWATPDGQASRASWRRALPAVSLYESIIDRSAHGQGSVSAAGCVIP